MTEPAGTPASAIRHESKTGGAKDLKIQRYDQIPTGPLAELAARYGAGSLKYPQKNGLDNWRNGYPWSWSYRALVGHANDFWNGETYDPNTYLGTDDESPVDEDGKPRPGTHHLAAVAWHALAMIDWLETHPEHDDRPSTVRRRNAAGLSATEDVPEDDEEQVKLFTYPKTTVKPEELYDQGGWMDVGASFGVIAGDLRLPPPSGQPITLEDTVESITRRTYIPNPKVEDKGDGKFTITPQPSRAETPYLELDDYVRIEDSTDLAFVGDQYATVVAVKRDGMAVRYDVRLTGCAYTLLDLKPSQLVKQ